jgi:hypothetical protein
MFKLLLGAFLFTAFSFNSHLYSQEIHKTYMTFAGGTNAPVSPEAFREKYNAGFEFYIGAERNINSLLTPGAEIGMSIFPTISGGGITHDPSNANIINALSLDAFLKLQNNDERVNMFQPFVKGGAGLYSTLKKQNEEVYNPVKGTSAYVLFGSGLNYLTDADFKFTLTAEYRVYFVSDRNASSFQLKAGFSNIPWLK